MKYSSQQKNILFAAFGFIAVIIIVALIGFFTLNNTPDIIQGEIEVGEYRVSSKIPGRVVEIRVKEGDYVHIGDTLAIIDAPELNAKIDQAKSAESAATALSNMASKGAREEQIRGSRELWNQAQAGLELAKASYERIQRLYDEGIVTAQKRDEALANYKSFDAQCKAAKSQYDMAVNGARQEERAAAQAQVRRASGALKEVSSYNKETIQIATVEGEVCNIYPKVGELVGTGSPIMSIYTMNDINGVFNVREDKLNGLKIGDSITAYLPAFDKNLTFRIYYIKDQGAYAVWKATKSSGQYDLKTFEVKARPIENVDGLRPGMSLIIDDDKLTIPRK